MTNLRGYNQICLCKNGEKRTIHTVHSVVLRAFIGRRPDGISINHRNGIKNDNHLENLEYCTASENMLHSCRVLKKNAGDNHYMRKDSSKIVLKGERHGMSSLTKSQVETIRKMRDGGAKLQFIAEIFRTTMCNVSAICKFRLWGHVE